MNHFTFPIFAVLLLESLIFLSTQKLPVQEILFDLGVDNCVQMIRDQLMSCFP